MSQPVRRYGQLYQDQEGKKTSWQKAIVVIVVIAFLGMGIVVFIARVL